MDREAAKRCEEWLSMSHLVRAEAIIRSGIDFNPKSGDRIIVANIAGAIALALAEAEQAATLAERERCERECEWVCIQVDSWGSLSSDERIRIRANNEACEAIAAKIREGTS